MVREDDLETDKPLPLPAIATVDSKPTIDETYARLEKLDVRISAIETLQTALVDSNLVSENTQRKTNQRLLGIAAAVMFISSIIAIILSDNAIACILALGTGTALANVAIDFVSGASKPQWSAVARTAALVVLIAGVVFREMAQPIGGLTPKMIKEVQILVRAAQLGSTPQPSASQQNIPSLTAPPPSQIINSNGVSKPATQQAVPRSTP